MNAQFRAAAFNYENQEDPRFDPRHDARWEAFELWASDQTDAEFAANCRDFFASLKSATGSLLRGPVSPCRICTVDVDGWNLFNDWQFENRYPGEKA